METVDKAHYAERRQSDYAAAKHRGDDSEKHLEALAGGFFLRRLRRRSAFVAVKIPLLSVVVAIGVCAAVTVIISLTGRVIRRRIALLCRAVLSGAALIGLVLVCIRGIAPTGGRFGIALAAGGVFFRRSTVHFISFIHIYTSFTKTLYEFEVWRVKSKAAQSGD